MLSLLAFQEFVSSVVSARALSDDLKRPQCDTQTSHSILVRSGQANVPRTDFAFVQSV